MSLPENIDQEKLAEVALVILYLGSYSEGNGPVRAWKGMDWDLTGLLHEKGWISDPVGKQKSVVMYDDAVELAEQFLKKHFGK